MRTTNLSIFEESGGGSQTSSDILGNNLKFWPHLWRGLGLSTRGLEWRENIYTHRLVLSFGDLQGTGGDCEYRSIYVFKHI